MDEVYGTSVGAINAPFIAAKRMDLLAKHWESKDPIGTMSVPHRMCGFLRVWRAWTPLADDADRYVSSCLSPPMPSCPATPENHGSVCCRCRS